MHTVSFYLSLSLSPLIVSMHFWIHISIVSVWVNYTVPMLARYIWSQYIMNDWVSANFDDDAQTNCCCLSKLLLISDTIQTIFCWWRYELIFKHRRTCWLLMWLVLCFTYYIYYLHTWAIQHSSVQQVEFVTIFTWKKNIILVPTFCFPPVIYWNRCIWATLICLLRSFV